MEALLEALTLYAEENLIFPLVQAYTPQIRGARIRADRLKEELRILAPEAEERLETMAQILGELIDTEDDLIKGTMQSDAELRRRRRKNK